MRGRCGIVRLTAMTDDDHLALLSQIKWLADYVCRQEAWQRAILEYLREQPSFDRARFAELLAIEQQRPVPIDVSPDEADRIRTQFEWLASHKGDPQ